MTLTSYCARAAMMLICAVAAFPSAAAEVPRGIGAIELGMTPAEVIAKLRETQAGGEIKQFESAYSYTDGAKTFELPSFISRISGNYEGPERHSRYVVHFSAHWEDPRVVGIWRLFGPAGISEDLPTVESYWQALVEKYGPTHRVYQTNRDLNVPTKMDWVFPSGSVQCAYVSNGQDVYMGEPDHLPKVLAGVRSMDSCGTYLVYQIMIAGMRPSQRNEVARTSPFARGTIAYMLDVQTAYASVVRAQESIGAVQANAIEARKRAAPKPQIE